MNKIEYHIVNYDRMILYVWYDENNIKRCKMGEVYVKAGENPYDKVVNRMKDYVDPVRVDLGEIKLEGFIDVTDYAKKHNKFKPKAKVDDFMRSNSLIKDSILIYNNNKKSEYHNLEAKIMLDKIIDVLEKDNINYRPTIKEKLKGNDIRWYQELFSNIYEELYNIKSLFLLAFACGKGKTLTIILTLLKLFNKIDGDVYLLTTKPSTLNDYLSWLETKEIRDKYDIVFLSDEINDNVFDYNKLGNKKKIFISSKQFLDIFLTGKDKKNKFNKSFVDTMKTKISLLISDEGHWGANTEITNQIHSMFDDSVNSIFNENIKILYSTATPGALLYKYGFDRDNQFYLNNEIEVMYCDFISDINQINYNKLVDTISNNGNNKEIIGRGITNFLIENFS